VLISRASSSWSNTYVRVGREEEKEEEKGGRRREGGEEGKKER